MGTQEPAERITEVGAAFWYGFAFGDLIIYIPLMIAGLIGHLRSARWGLVALAAAMGITVYWPIVCLAALVDARNAEGWEIVSEMHPADDGGSCADGIPTFKRLLTSTPNPKRNMKILFFGAGPLGILYAHRLHESGADVTILARGGKLELIKTRSLSLVNGFTGERAVPGFKVIDHLSVGTPKIRSQVSDRSGFF